MSCTACTLAAKRIAHEFNDCSGCRARAVARSPRFSEAVKGGRQCRRSTAERWRMEAAAAKTGADLAQLEADINAMG